MQIIVVGIGGVGGYFGGRLALTDHRVEFVARGTHGKAIRENGLEVKSIDGDFRAFPYKVHETLDTIDAPDLVLVCTKSWQLEEVAQQLAGRIKSNTLVLPLQNGVESVEKLTGHLDPGQVLGGLCKVISKIDGPGIIDHFAFHPQVIFGEVNGERTERAIALEGVFRSAGIDVILSDDIQLAVWRKFLFICMISGMGAITRQEIGVMRADEHIRALMETSGKEILELAKHKGVGLTEKDLENAFRAIDAQKYHSTASVQRDLMAGRPSELHDFNGYVVREAEKYGVEVPVNAFIYYCLRPMEAKSRAHE
ncbi:ketopantoate reductase family protein [Robertkochia sediminum]|uniref:ketopantoate reductase family protein n=1 Tax=Robertkochia sediminum TaxID=2785326 RepID=UPI001933B9EA|nr:2-dehydropantoate 2-reductase [Robertkochia sediminum]MBL7472369.1 2-dehydropantoate 2-reductase [Robertkochia sediminum]